MQGTQTTTAQLAHELRETVGRLVRRLRAEPGPPFAQLAVLGRLDREGPASISDLAAAERMRPQSMAQTVRDLEDAGLVSRRPDPRGRPALVRRAHRRRAADAARDPRAARGLADPDPGARARRRASASCCAGRWRCWTASPAPERVSPAGRPRALRPRRPGRPRSSRCPPRSARRLAALVRQVAKSALACWTAPSRRWRRSSSAPAVTASTVTAVLVTFDGAPGAPGALEALDDGLRRASPTRVRLAGQLDGQVAAPGPRPRPSRSTPADARASPRAPAYAARETSTLRGQATSCSARRFHSALSSRQPSSVRVRFQ